MIMLLIFYSYAFGYQNCDLTRKIIRAYNFTLPPQVKSWVEL